MNPPQPDRTIRARFSSAAPSYAGVAQVQRHVAHRLLDMIPGGFEPHSVLDAGCGSGWLLGLIRQRWPYARLTGVDIAPGMIAEARSQFVNDPRVDFIVHDIGDFRTNAWFDIVISSSALHWVKPFAAGMAGVASLCRPGGFLAVAIMLNGTLCELHESRNLAAPDKSPAGRLPDLSELEQAFLRIPGIRIINIRQATMEYHEASGADVLHKMHEMGVTGGDVSRGRAPLNRRELRELIRWYDLLHSTPAGVRISFVIGYLLAERTSI